MDTPLRNLVDEISSNVLCYLEKNKYVSNIELREVKGAQSYAISAFERKNVPYKLPCDFQTFLLLMNGISVKWFVSFKEQACQIGHIHINSLEDIKRHEFTGHEVIGNKIVPIQNDDLYDISQENSLVAFTLESSPSLGDVVLLYKNDYEDPQIWLLDLYGKWNFIAQSFSDYYRLMIIHLGLLTWQNIFTDIGINPTIKQWFYLFIPARLKFDEDERTKEVEACNS